MASEFAPAEKMFRWGCECIFDFERMERSFFDACPLREVVDDDSESGKKTLKVVSDISIPEDIERVVTTGLGNIKHSFDRAIYAACASIGKAPNGHSSVNCPWADTAHASRAMLASKNAKVPPELHAAILRFEPYGRSESGSDGDDVARQLAKIANRKHTVDLTFAPLINNAVLGGASFQKQPGTLWLPTHLTWNSMKNEVIIAQISTTEDLDYEYTLDLNIAFDEAGALFQVPARAALRHFAARAQRAIKVLREEVDRLRG